MNPAPAGDFGAFVVYEMQAGDTLANGPCEVLGIGAGDILVIGLVVGAGMLLVPGAQFGEAVVEVDSKWVRRAELRWALCARDWCE